MEMIKEVGGRIKSLRRSQGLSREELARLAGLPLRELERIEDNVDLPSLAPLIKIARVLGVRLGTFLDDDGGGGLAGGGGGGDVAGRGRERAPVICRRGEQLPGLRFSNNALENRRHITYHSLASTSVGAGGGGGISGSERHIEPFLIDVAPVDDADAFVLSVHEGEEFIMVLEGTMELTYGDGVYQLHEGDTVYYSSQVPHHIHGYRGGAARVLAVFYAPM